MLAAGYGIFSGTKLQWAKLRFTPQQARWVAGELWHPEQRATLEPDGSYVLELPYANPTELVMDILRHGSGVEVIAPASLRSAVGQTLAEASAQY